MDQSTLYAAIPIILALVFAITTHEAAHGFVARLFGDLTAQMQGRVTFNPIKHIDPIGTIALPAILFLFHSPVVFGWAKPVPVDFRNLRPARLGMILVAAAGPGVDTLLAWISALLLHLNPDTMTLGNEVLMWSIRINCVLAVFNLLPLPPLDGGRVAVGLLPRGPAQALANVEPYGMLIILLLIMLPGNILWHIIGPIIQWLMAFVVMASGH